MRNFLIIDGFYKQRLSYKNMLNFSEILLIIAYELKVLNYDVDYFCYDERSLEDLEKSISKSDNIIILASDIKNISTTFENISNFIVIADTKITYKDIYNIIHWDITKKFFVNIENTIQNITGKNNYIYKFSLNYWSLLGEISSKSVEISSLDILENILSEFKFLVKKGVKCIVLSFKESILNVELITKVASLAKELSNNYNFIWNFKCIWDFHSFCISNCNLTNSNIGQISICTNHIDENLYKFLHKSIQYDNILSIKIILHINNSKNWEQLLEKASYILSLFHECIEFELEYDKTKANREDLVIYQNFYSSVLSLSLKYRNIKTSLYHINLYNYNILTSYYTYFVSKTSLNNLFVYIQNGWSLLNDIKKDSLREYQVKILGRIYNSNNKKYILCDPYLFTISYIEINYHQYSLFNLLKSNKVISRIETDFLELYPNINTSHKDFIYNFLQLLNKYNLVVFKRGLI